jgi:hypothetical protein
MTAHTILLHGGQVNETAVITETESPYICALTCDYRGKSVRAKANDFFAALCLIRRKLEGEGLIPFCYGASLNVYPSGMARDMALGKKAYRIKPGRHATSADLVDIFDAGPDVIPSTVEMQRKFFLDWVSSERV